MQNTCIVRTMLARLLFSEDSLRKCVRVLSGGERVGLALIVFSHDITFVDAIATQKFLIRDKKIMEMEIHR